MRTHILCLAAVALATPIGAQAPRISRAFEPAVTPWIGIHNFGERAWISVPGGAGADPQAVNAGYSPSLAVGAMVDLPLTRRVGFLGDLHLAPLGKQEQSDDASAVQLERALSYAASASLAFRFRPQAPIFFFGGAALVGSSRKAVSGSDGGAMAPGGTAGLGLDLARRGRIGARLVYQYYWLKPGDPDFGDWKKQNSASDWTLGLGARINLHAPAAPGAAGGAR